MNYAIKIVLLLTAILLWGCSDINNVEVETDQDREVAVPIVNTFISVMNFVNNTDVTTTIDVDEEGKVSVVYKGSIFSRDLDELFVNNIPVIGIPLEGNSTKIEDIFKDDQIIKKGTANANSEMLIGFTNPSADSIQVEFSLPQMFNESTPFTAQFDVGPGEEFTSDTFRIAGYQLIPDEENIYVNYTAKDRSGNDVALEAAIIGFRNLGFSLIEGYLGYEKIDLADERIHINIFDNWENGTIFLEDPKINLHVENSFGFPMRVNINQLDFVSPNATNSLESSFIDNGIDFNYPRLDEVGVTKSTLFNFDQSNSNIRDIISESTNYIDYDLSVKVNPDQDESIIGFGRVNDNFNINLDATLPLFGKVSDLVLRDTVSYTIDETDNINAVEFKLITGNSFPADLQLSIYTLDATGNVVDNLFSDIQLESPALDAEGKVIAPVENTVYIPKSGAEIQELLKNDRLLIELRLSTIEAGARSIWVYDEFGVEIKLGAIINLTIDE